MFQKILIANRGEIAVRIERTLKRLGIASVGVYSQFDQDSLHVENADTAIFLGDGDIRNTYLDSEKIIKAALDTGAEAIHPGYGFFSENDKFAVLCRENGLRFIGPAPEQIAQFGLKHSAREIAEKAGVPLLPGTKLLNSIGEAAETAKAIGYPVMLKSTAGGGGIGMQVCRNEEELQQAFNSVPRVAEENFKNNGVFLEKYIPRARHIEIQIFGNEYGEVIALGERDCSVQRRNQKVVEESPAPGIPPEIRSQMVSAAERLAAEVQYRNVGTVEFLYDSEAEEFFFLEVNTRLQVEHGITEAVFGIDLVEWMVKEAAGELKDLKSLVSIQHGHAIEVRIYAEDCLNNFHPRSGKIDYAAFDTLARVETWLRKGIEVTPMYDPLLAKLIVHGEDRQDAVSKMLRVLRNSRIYGITTNLQYLKALFETSEYQEAQLFTAMLNGFSPEENALEVLDGGVQTTVQDYPGMVGYWHVGVPPCGAFDSFSFRLGNRLLNNPEGAPGLEMTMRGGSYRFRTAMSFCLTGADMNAELDGVPVSMYKVVHAKAMQVLKLNSCRTGMRTYLLIAGGLDMPLTMGSSSTFMDGKFGGYGGRALRTGDILRVHEQSLLRTENSIPDKYIPQITNHWTIGVLPGPQPTSEYLKPEYLETLTSAEYEVNFNSARTGVRLNGAVPQWAREDGGEAGLHPSNIHDNAYSIGALNLTGDQSVLLGPDGPSLGGFVCPVVTALGERWKLGQLRPGDKVQFRLLTLESAAAIRNAQEKCIAGEYAEIVASVPEKLPEAEYAVLQRDCAAGTDIVIRLSGEDNILVEYGKMELDIELRFRVHILMEEIKKTNLPIIDLTPGIRSLQVHFDINRIDAVQMSRSILQMNRDLPELNDIAVPSRIFHLPLSWDDPQTRIAAERYQQTVRPNAPWCPSNPEFIRRINGLNSIEDVQNIVFNANYLVLGLGDVYLGAPVAVPIDPRNLLVTTKYNPARPWTPENAVGIGGAYLCIYGMEGPGGYQFVGRTIQTWNSFMETDMFTADKPWLLNFFDQLKFYPVSSNQLLQYRNDFLRGKFHIQIEETVFTLGAYKKFLQENHEEIDSFKKRQKTAFDAEKHRWKEQGLDNFVSELPVTPAITEAAAAEGSENIKALLPGSVWRVLVHEGETVKKGDTIIIMESMKIEFPIISEYSGIIQKVYLHPGQLVSADQTAVVIRIAEK